MRKVLFAALFVHVAVFSARSFAAAPRFIMVSDHCGYLPLKEGGENVGAVVTEAGVLLINPPREQNLSAVIEALAPMNTKGVRWVVFTEPASGRNADSRWLAERNILVLAGSSLHKLSPMEPTRQNGNTPASPVPARLIFERRMRLYPANLEVRVMALQNRARTGGDMVVFVPAEKILFVGGLFEAARYPEIDTQAGGDALSWLDGMKEVIDAVPVLKPATPVQAAKTDQQKTLEEGIRVISSRGEPSNLQNMKDLLESCKKLRMEIARAVKSGRSCDSFLASPAAAPYWSYGNLESYARQLFSALSR